MDEPYRIRFSRAGIPVTTLYCTHRFLVIQCVGETDEKKARDRCIKLYGEMEKEDELLHTV